MINKKLDDLAEDAVEDLMFMDDCPKNKKEAEYILASITNKLLKRF